MIKFTIGTYEVMVHAGPSQPVKVYLTDDSGKYRGYILFIKDYDAAQKFVVHPNGIINLFMPLENLHFTLDILRNEKPLFITVNEEYNWASLNTAHEPAGEEEFH
ncbi:MAG TPA: hypothetical protein PKN48_11510 [Bacteroidales bacterium]|nr:hypothetical protein [Bacteroidales bacterium]